jgi:hypothetical protein
MAGNVVNIKTNVTMRNILFKILGVFLILMLSQTQKSFGQIDLLGHWTAHCIIERLDKSSIVFCDFCPYGISEDKANINFEVFEMDFENDYFNLIIDSISTKVDYKMEKEFDTIEFTYKEETYRFKVLSIFNNTTTNLLLKDSEGMLILLEKNE